ncbi:MAG TPA: DinB family protein [Anaerolineales bacterium]|nr:DinB family protein [Anaerolineales bacterium]
MELSQWFDYQLRSTLDGFVWAVRQVPQERLHTVPPPSLGEWSAAQHVSHILDYEERLALPSMAQWLGVPPMIPEDSEKGVEQTSPSIEAKIARFERVRQAEINLLSKFDPDAWGTVKRTTFWGDVSLFWLVCKTYQHTAEHTHNVLSLTLFWDTTIKRPTH